MLFKVSSPAGGVQGHFMANRYKTPDDPPVLCKRIGADACSIECGLEIATWTAKSFTALLSAANTEAKYPLI